MNVMNNSGKARCPLGYKCPDKVKFHNITSKAYREHKALANKQKKGNKNNKTIRIHKEVRWMILTQGIISKNSRKNKKKPTSMGIKRT